MLERVTIEFYSKVSPRDNRYMETLGILVWNQLFLYGSVFWNLKAWLQIDARYANKLVWYIFYPHLFETEINSLYHYIVIPFPVFFKLLSALGVIMCWFHSMPILYVYSRGFYIYCFCSLITSFYYAP
jgi:hypothetical protein